MRPARYLSNIQLSNSREPDVASRKFAGFILTTGFIFYKIHVIINGRRFVELSTL